MGVTSQVTVSPGEVAPVSGQYRPVRGGMETTLVKGKIAPPTPHGGDWVLVDPTQHKY